MSKKMSLFRLLTVGIGVLGALSPTAFAQERQSEPSLKPGTSNAKQFQATLNVPTPMMLDVRTNNEVFTQLNFPNIPFTTDDPGKPGVPVLRRLIALPKGAQPRVLLGDGSVRTVEKINLWPAQANSLDQRDPNQPPPLETFADPKFVKDEEAYKTDADFPKDPVVIRPIGQYRELTLAQVDIAVGQYNPVRKTLKLFNSLPFNIMFEGGNGKFLTSASLNPFESGKNNYLGSVINQEAVLANVENVRISWKFLGEEFLILTPPAFRAAADNLAKWKNDKGILTHVFNVNDGTGPGPDTRAQIDAFIEDRYNSNLIRPSYVLLLGDAEFIPPFYVSTSGSATTGTDYPYALLGAGDLVPDFALGRIPVDTLAQANTVVNKVINYEKNPPFSNSFYNNATVASQFQCCRDGAAAGTDQRTFIEVSEFARNVMQGAGKTVQRIYTKTGTGTPNRYYDGGLLPADLRSGSGFPWSGSQADITAAVNAGKFLVMHRDHGWEGGWAHPLWNTANATAANNGSLLPVVFSVNCASGLFDNETAAGDYGTTVGGVYFAEALLRNANGGAVGILGDTRNSPSWPNTALAKGFFDAIWPSALPGYGNGAVRRRLGDILNHGKMFMVSQVGVAGAGVSAGSANDELYMWHAIGDPTLEIWKGNPIKLTANYFPEVVRGGLQVRYEQDGAEITAYQELQDGTLKPIGRGIVNDGTANLPFVETPDSSLPIQYSASFESGISIKLPPVASKYRPLDFVVGPDLKSRLLWTRSDGAGYIWRLNNAGNQEASNGYGPYAGVNVRAVAQGPDNVTRVLWRYNTGNYSLWRVSATGAILSSIGIASSTSWSIRDLAVGPDNITRVLWHNSSTGGVQVWRYNATLGSLGATALGNHPAYTPLELAVGPDNVTRVLLNHNASGQAWVWRLSPVNAVISTFTVGPYNGWRSVSVSVGADNQTRLLMHSNTGNWRIFFLNPTTGAILFANGGNKTLDWRPITISTERTGGTNRTTAMWVQNTGKVQLDYYNNTGGFLFSKSYGPY